MDGYDAADDRNARINEAVYEPCRWICKRGCKYRFLRDISEPYIDFLELVDNIILVVEGLNDLLVTDHVIYYGGHLSPDVGLSLEHRKGLL